MKYIKRFVGACLVLTTLATTSVYAQSTDAYQDGYVIRTETVWTTRTVEQPVSHTHCRQVEPSIGDLVVGGLIGSTLGNNITDAHGAGTVGAVAGILTATNFNSGQKCQKETRYISKSERYPSHYIIHVRSGGQHLQFSSDRPYQVRERVKLHVSSDYSLVD